MVRPVLVLLVALVAAGCAGSYGSKPGSADGGAAASSTPAVQAAPATPATPTVPPPATGKVHKLASGLVYEDLVIGNGKMADPGLSVAVNYTGRLTDGTEFDSSSRRGQPYTFVLGTAAVIAGWDQGIKGMRIGGKRKLTIPPDLAYGDEGRPPVIPPKSTLVFEVELVGVR